MITKDRLKRSDWRSNERYFNYRKKDYYARNYHNIIFEKIISIEKSMNKAQHVP